MNPSNWTSEQYLILGYAVSVIILWGYAVLLWKESTSLRHRERSNTSNVTPDIARQEEA
jgi:hypothetical protein